MQLDEITSSLRQRGAIWQGAGFAVVGVAAVAALWVYSDSDHWIMGTYRLAATQVNWAFFGAIALLIEGVRAVFEKADVIRARFSAKLDAKAEAKGRAKGIEEGHEKGLEEGLEKGEREALARIRSKMQQRGIKLSKEDEDAIFTPYGHSR